MNYIYGELVIIENLLINFVILKMTSVITKKKLRKANVFFAALLGAIYTILQYQYAVFTHLSYKIFLSIAIIIISFFPKSLKEFTNQILTFYFVTLLFGGFVLALIILGNRDSNISITISGVGATTLFIGIFSGVLAAIKIKELVLDSKFKAKSILDIRIKLGDKEITIRGFKDTGCSITDGLTGKPILIVEYDKLKEILPNEILDYLKNYDGKLDYDIHKKIDDLNLLKRIKFVPYSTVNSSEDTHMFCFKFDEVTIFDENNKYYIEKLYIGVSENRFSPNSEFQALINPKLLYTNGGYGQ